MQVKQEPSKLVDLLTRITFWLREHTLLKILFWLIPRLDTDSFTELWVGGATALSIVALVSAPSNSTVIIVFAILGTARLVGILANVSYISLFHGRFNQKPLTSRRRTVVLFLLNYVELIFWFSYFFLYLPTQGRVEEIDRRIAVFSLSLSNASGIGQPLVQASSNLSVTVGILESAIGLFMIIAVLARVIGLMPPMPENRKN